VKYSEHAPVPRTRNRRGEGGRLREEIVGAAAALLDEHGDERAITLRSVARRAGIAAPSIYPHFANQPEIMFAVVGRAFDELADVLQSAVRAAGEGPRAQLYAACFAYLDFASSHPGSYRTMFGGLWVPELDDTVTEEKLLGLGAASMHILSAALNACVAAGLSTSDAPDADAVALWLALHGIAHQRAANRIFPGPNNIEERVIPALARLREDGPGRAVPQIPPSP
jgi:AcrR family transcriptional regulator